MPHAGRGGIAIAPDGTRLFSTAFGVPEGGTRSDAVPLVRIWDVAKRSVLASVEGVGPLACSADGRTLFATNGRGRPWIYRLEWALATHRARLLEAEDQTGLVMQGLRIRARGAADLIPLVDEPFAGRHAREPWSR